MRRASKAIICSSFLVLANAGVVWAASMGSLAPRDATANSPGQQQWVTDARNNCRAIDSDFDPDDSITWDGTCAFGFANGSGTLSFLNRGHVIETVNGKFSQGVLQTGHVLATWSDGSKYDGNQSGGLFDGAGTFTSATRDKLDGEWKAGALNGHASVLWANGDRYDGVWKNGKSDGQGTEIWADGRRFEGQWEAGKPVTADTQAAALPSASAPTAPPSSPTPSPEPGGATAIAAAAVAEAPPDADEQANVPASPLGALIGRKLVAVDGSTIDLNPSEGGFTSVVTMPNGVSQQISFAFMNPRLGMVSSDSAAVGLFRTSPAELQIDFTDGNTEVMKPDSAGGLLVTAYGADGTSTCAAWHPDGHVFGDGEKKAAVLEYAARLGVAIPASTRKRPAAPVAPRACGGAFLINLPQNGATAADSTNTKPAASAALPDTRPAQVKNARAPLTNSQDLQNVAVKFSAVHLIDAPYVAASAQGSIVDASLAVNPARLQQAPNTAQPVGLPAQEPLNASQCLSVSSDGAYWGFKNGCAKTLQFVYCEMGVANPLTSCGRTNVSGSVAANGFSALVSDKSLSEQGIKHDFRWLACDGGAGEVVPHLDGVDPPAGRCMRTLAAER